MCAHSERSHLEGKRGSMRRAREGGSLRVRLHRRLCRLKSHEQPGPQCTQGKPAQLPRSLCKLCCSWIQRWPVPTRQAPVGTAPAVVCRHGEESEAAG